MPTQKKKMDGQSSPLVSILINNYNYARFLHEAIDSALHQTYSHVEVIVVDDGSTDESREIIASYGSCIIPVLKENGGQASAFNAGFAQSKGDIICFLDSDDLYLDQKTDIVVNVFAQYNDIGSCFHPLKTVYKRSTSLTSERSSIDTGLYRPGWHDFRMEMRRGDLPYIATATSGLSFRRSLLEQILPMPEAEGVSLHDNYLKFTSLALGTTYFMNMELAVQRIHEDNLYTQRYDKQSLRARNLVLTAYWIHKRFPQLTSFANSLFLKGLIAYLQSGGIETRYRATVVNYLLSVPIYDKIKIGHDLLNHGVRFIGRRLTLR